MEVRGERQARTIGYSSVMMERQVGITHGPCQIKKSVDLYNRSGFRDDRGASSRFKQRAQRTVSTTGIVTREEEKGVMVQAGADRRVNLELFSD